MLSGSPACSPGDTELQVGVPCTSELAGRSNQPAYAIPVESLEGFLWKNSFF